MDPHRVVELLGRWSTGSGPLYLLLAGRLRQLIDDGDLEPGALLPPDRSFARALAVGRGTVVNAYEQLRMDGRIVRRRGSGTRVAGTSATNGTGAEVTTQPMFVALLEPSEGVIGLACAAPTAPPGELIDAYRTATLEMASIKDDIGYHPIGIRRLREALADRYTEHGVPSSPQEIMITGGGQQALGLLAQCLLRPGDQVAIEAPTYPGALEAFREAGAATVPVGLGLDGFDRAIQERRLSLAYVIPTNQNPTGTTVHSLRRDRLTATAAAADIPVIEDEVLADLTFPDHEKPAPLATDQRATVISVGSLSKTVWGGLRIGWIRAPEAIINRLARLRAIHDLGGNVPAQIAAVELMTVLDEVSRRQAALLKLRHDHLRARLLEAIPEWSIPSAHGGQTLWVRLPRGDGTSFAQAALRHGVAVLPGDTLDASRRSPHRIRIHYALPEAALTEAVDRLAAAWSMYDPPHRAHSGASVLAV